MLANRILTGAWPDLRLLGEADYLLHLTPLGVLWSVVVDIRPG
jgi:hypothetical protein